MGDVSRLLRGFEGPRGSCEVGQQFQRGRREAVMAERGKEQLAVVSTLFIIILTCQCLRGRHRMSMFGFYRQEELIRDVSVCVYL